MPASLNRAIVDSDTPVPPPRTPTTLQTIYSVRAVCAQHTASCASSLRSANPRSVLFSVVSAPPVSRRWGLGSLPENGSPALARILQLTPARGIRHADLGHE